MDMTSTITGTSRLGRWALATTVAAALALPTLFGRAGFAADLFQPLPPTAAAAMAGDQQSSVDRIRSLPTTAAVEVVTINLDALRDTTTTLALPGAPQVTATESSRDVRSDRDYTWHGSLAGIPGAATLVVRDGNVTGSINTGTDVYKVTPVGNGLHAIIKFDASRLPPEHPPSFRERERRGDTAPVPEQRDVRADVPTMIDVLVAYTPSAVAQVPDMAALVQLAIDEANQSYVNSQINLRLRLVHTYQVTYSESGKSYDTIVADLAGKTDGSMDEIHQRRDQFGADLVALIVNQTDYCGMADAIMATESTAFAAVHFNCATGYYSFAHELGHLMGARHDPANDSSTTPFAYGHGFQQGTAWRTIMAYVCASSCPRLQYWSNPNVNYSGTPMGTATTHNNARVLNATAPTIAAFRTAAAAGGWHGWESLGGIILEQPDCVTWSANRIDCFARGTDRAMYHRWWNGSAWGGWESLGGVLLNAPDCVSWSANRIDCFGRGTDGAMYHRWWNGSAWGGWESLGGIILEQPECVSWGANRIDCFARGTDRAMYHRWWNGSAWGGWESLGGIILDQPSCVTWSANRIDCFARGTDRAMYHRWWDGSAWGGWENLGGVLLNAPDCVTWSANRIDCFGRGTDGAMYHRWWNGSAWGGWESLGGIILEQPNCVSWGANRIDCFARGTDRAMYHRWWNGSAWGGWESLGGIILEQPNCVSWSANRLDCFARGTDGAMYHRWWAG
jgi:hypothetical protein